MPISVPEIITYYWWRALDPREVGSLDIDVIIRVCVEEKITDLLFDARYIAPSPDYPRGCYLVIGIASFGGTDAAFDSVLPLISRRRFDLN